MEGMEEAEPGELGALFAGPGSPGLSDGLSSMLRCLGDGSAMEDDASSFLAAQALGPLAADAPPLHPPAHAKPEPLPAEGAAGPIAPPGVAADASDGSAAAQAAAAAGAAAQPAAAAAGGAGEAAAAAAAAPGAAPHAAPGGAGGIVVRRRGRKPKPRLPDLQDQLDALNEQFKQLSRENGMLKNKLKVLERVVPYRDESVGLITQLLAAAPPLPPALPPGFDPPQQQEQQPATPGSPTSSASETTGSGGASTATTGAGSRAATPDLRSSAATGSAAAAGGGGGGAPSESNSSGVPLIVAMCPTPDAPAPPLTLAALREFRRVTPTQFCRLWSHICLQMGVLVQGASAHGPGSPPYARLERFLKNVMEYLDKITLLSPTAFVQSMYVNVETGAPERPSDAFWINCARALKLTPQQLGEVTTLAEVYAQNVGPVMQQRMQLSAELASRLAAASSGNSAEALVALQAVDAVAQALQRNALAEHKEHWTIGDFLVSSVLSPLQVAQALTVAYPWIPDGVAMLHAFKLLAAETQPGGAAGARGVAFPSFAGVLAAQFAQVVAARAAAAAQAQAQAQARSAAAAAAAQAQASTSGGAPGGAEAPAARPLVAAQLAALAGRLQPAQLQALLAAAQAAGRAGGQAGLPTGAAQGTQRAASLTAAQLQGLAALLGAAGGAGAVGSTAGGTAMMGTRTPGAGA